MRRELASVRRLTLKREVPLVPCCYADGELNRWDGTLGTCGAMVPYHPRHPCPNCGRRLLKPHAPPPDEDSRVIDDSVAIIDEATRKVVAVHVVCASDLASDLARSLGRVHFDTQIYSAATTTARLNGMAVTHRTFGYQPPQPMRRRYGCSRSQFNSEYPEAMDQIAQFCRVAEHVFRTYAEDAYNSTALGVMDAIAPAWRIAGTPWTSGIINKTAALPYHLDSDNITKSWSAMIACRRHVSGGLLHLADYDTYFAVPHGSITIFDGQSIVHGVTPMSLVGPHAHRYTLVTYSKFLMKKCCADPAGEPRRAAMEATIAEDRRATGFRPTRRTRTYVDPVDVPQPTPTASSD